MKSEPSHALQDLRSTARDPGTPAIGQTMTGMGDDGARGMLERKEVGAITLAQDQAFCVVFGMPGAACKLGGVTSVLPLDKIAGELMRRSA